MTYDAETLVVPDDAEIDIDTLDVNDDRYTEKQYGLLATTKEEVCITFPVLEVKSNKSPVGVAVVVIGVSFVANF
jgi:hypothetical protein